MSDTNTNNPSLPDFDSFFKNQGKPIGYDPTDAEMDLARAVLVPVTKELIMRQFAPKEGAEKLGTRTNEVTSDVLRTIEYPDGTFKPYEAQIIQTTGGFEELVGPGTTRAITNRDTGRQPQGYVASGGGWGMGQQLTVGANNDAARAAAAAQQGQAVAPAPAPAPDAPPPLSMTNSAGAAMTFASPYQVREAFMKNQINQDEAKRALLHWGMK
jgi:hypothetical protein